jgi:phenylacetic acid degradation protein paaN
MADDGTGAPATLDDLLAAHLPLLEQARVAIHERGYWSAFTESPSTKVWGEAAPAAGLTAFDALLGKDFPLHTPGASGTVSPERSPYGTTLAVAYPHLRLDGVGELMVAARAGMPAWRDAGAAARACVCVEILQRLHARSFQMAHAVMQTTGQGFVMAFQAGGAHALDRALEAIAYAYDAMAAVPAQVDWVKPRGRGEPQRLRKTFTVIPRGVAVVIGCATFPTWNSYPGLFASLATGNPVVVKPHPQAVLPLALTVATAREVLAEHGFNPNLATLAVEDAGEGLASDLALHPQVRIIDYTGSGGYGRWLEEHARQALVFTEKSGVNVVVVDSTDDLAGTAANLAYSLALYTGQMCTAPQVILLPAAAIRADGRHCGVDEFVAALSDALDALLGSAATAAAVLGAVVDDRVLERLAAAASSDQVVIGSKPLQHRDFPAARLATPLVARVAAEQLDVYGEECFGPVSFVVETKDTAHSLELWRSLATSRGSITASVYSTSKQVLAAAQEVALEAAVSYSVNLTGDVYVNQTSAYSDFHATGANPAANASLVDTAFVAGRFRVVECRQPM